MSHPTSEDAGRRAGRLALRLAIVATALGAIVWTVRGLEPRQVLRAAMAAHPGWLAVSLLPIGARFAIWAFKWQRMLRRRAEVPYVLCLHVLLAGSFVNLTTPTAKLAGGVVRASLLHRRAGWPRLEAYGWAMADQVTNVLGHLALFGVLSVGAALHLPPGTLRTSLACGGIAMCVGVVVAAALRGVGWRLSQRPAVGRTLQRMIPSRFRVEGGSAEYTERLGRVLRPLLRDEVVGSTFVPDVAWSALAFASLCVANGLVLHAVGADVSWLLASVALAGGYFVGIALGAWGGIGVTEAALIGFYVQIGVAPDVAAAGALLHRSMFYAVVLGWGGVALWIESRRPTHARAGQGPTSNSTPV